MSDIKQSKWWAKLQKESFNFSRGGSRLNQLYHVMHYFQRQNSGPRSCTKYDLSTVLVKSFLFRCNSSAGHIQNPKICD